MPGQPGFGQPGSGQPGSGSSAGHPYGPPPPGGAPGQAPGTPGTGAPGPGRENGRDRPGSPRAGGTVIRQRDSALPDAPPGGGTGAIAAIESDNVASFARDLRALRAKAEMDYPDMAEKSHYTMRTLVSAAGGLRMPTLPVLTAYVRACGGDQSEWEERWSKIMRAADAQAALPAAGTSPATDPADRAGSEDPPAQPPGTTQPAGPDQAQTRAQEVYVITSAPARDDRR